jgi:hypothetical protein
MRINPFPTLFRIVRMILLLGCIFYSQLCLAFLHDPTRPADFNTDSAFDSSPLTAIIIAPDRKIAVVYGKTVKEGDQVGNSKVISIEENKVQLKSPDGIVTLRLVEKQVKKAVDPNP